MSENINLEDQIRGMLTGVALGDALGSPHEFDKLPYTGKLEHPARRRSRWRGTKYEVVGQVTDDTEMTLTLANTIANGYSRDQAVLNYQQWANSKCPTMGTNTRHLFSGVKTVKGYEKRFQTQPIGKINYSGALESQANGSLMRASPLVVLPLEEALTDTKITNPSDVNLDATRIYWTMMRLLLEGKDPITVFSSIKNLATSPETKKVIQQVESGEYRDITVKRGWVLHALYCALITITRYGDKFHSFGECMRWIITLEGDESRSDTDTNAAIAGGLIGCYLGYQRLSKEQGEGGEGNIEIMMNADTTLGDHPRPDEYHPRKIENLSHILAEMYR